MTKINTPGSSNEIHKEKKAGTAKTDPRLERGGAFVEEHTGSATLINVDGRWDFNHPTPGDKPEA